MNRRAVAASLVLLAALVACGGDDGGGATDDDGPAAIDVDVVDEVGPIEAVSTTCGFGADRQVTAGGVVRNNGENEQYVSVAVRFIDADGVRIDIASDSISELKPGESARWDASVYLDDRDAVVRCEVSPEAQG